MALPPLATVFDLTDYGHVVDPGQTATAQAALAAASEAVRDAAESPISATTSTVTILGPRTQYLDLPGGPVADVTSVAIDGNVVTDYKRMGGTLWRAGFWSVCHEPSVVEVTYTHGFTDVPADIKLLVCELAGAVMSAAEGGVETRTGVQSESIDDYSVTFETGSGALASSVELPDRTRARLRARFGGSVAVVGTR